MRTESLKRCNMINIEKEIQEFETFEDVEPLVVELQPDKKRRKELDRLLTYFECLFEVSDAETLNAIIKI
jgi:hypothetical protein